MTSSVETSYVYDGWNPIAEYTDTTLQKVYTWGTDLSGSLQGAGGVGGLLSVIDASGNHSYPTYDGNGNVSEYLALDSTTSPASAVIEAHYEYDSFGNTTAATGAKIDAFAHRFSTKLLEEETGYYYYGYRYYSPITGTWPSRDPIGENHKTGEFNLYAFVNNEVTSKWDYLGLKCCPVETKTPLKKGHICCDGTQIKKGRGNVHGKKCNCIKKGGVWTTVLQCDYNGDLTKCLLENSPSSSAARVGGIGLGIGSWLAQNQAVSLAFTKAGVALAALDWVTGAGLCGAPKCCIKNSIF